MSRGSDLHRVEDELRSGDRRRILRLLASAGIVLGPIGLPGLSRAAGRELRYDGFGGTTAEATAKAALDPFSRETGINIVRGTFGNQRDMLTKIRAGSPGDYHVLHMSGLDWYKRYVDLGYTSEIEEAKIPNLKWIMTPLVDAFRAITPKALAAVPFAYGTSGIAYNTKVVSREEVEEKGPAILLDPKYSGRLTGGNDAQARVWYAALQSGQDPNNIGDLEAVWQKARDSRQLVKKYWTSGAELMELFAKEEAVIGDAWSGRVAALQAQGFPIGYHEVPGVPAWIEGIMVLKDAPQEESQQLIDYLLRPEVAGAVAEGQKYPPALDPAKVVLSETVKKLPAFDATGKLERLKFPVPSYWAERLDAFEKQWNRVSKGA